MGVFQIFDNNAVTAVDATLLIAGTSLTVTTGQGVLFSAVTGTDTMKLTLENTGGDIEIVEVTAHTGASDVFTIVRAQEGTTAIQWEVGDVVELRLTAGYITDNLVPVDHNSTTALGLNALDIQTGRTDLTRNASGDQSIAIGFNSEASGQDSIAIGRNIQATQNDSIAMGEISSSTGSRSIALGTQSDASGADSFAVGANSEASGEYSLCFGNGQATQQGSINIGFGPYYAPPQTTGNNAIGIGRSVNVTGAGAVGIGRNVNVGGAYGVAIGAYAVCGSDRSIAIGHSSNVNATALKSVVLGRSSRVYAGCENSMVLGYRSQVRESADYTNVIGSYAYATVGGTTMVTGPIVVSDPYWNASTTAVERTKNLTGAVAVLSTQEVDFLALSNTDISLPTNFYLEEVGVICTKFNTLTTQPVISFGTTSGGVDIKASAITTGLTAADRRERFTSPLLDNVGHTGTLFANVDTVAVATELSGRFYFKGFFIETT